MSQAIYKSHIIYCLGYHLCNAAVSTILHTYTHPHTHTEQEREKLYSMGGFIWVKVIVSGGFVFHLIENIYNTSAKETRTQANLEMGPSHL